MDKSAEQYANVAARHYNSGRYEEALAACNYAIQVDPKSARAYHGKGLILVQQEKYAEALANYQKACEIAPLNAKVHADMAELFYMLKKYEKSGLAYKMAIRLDSRYERVYRDKAKYLINIASSMHTYWERDRAITIFQEALLFNPDDTIALPEILKLQNLKIPLNPNPSSIVDREEIHTANCRCYKCWEP